jgi:hypothetical protein
MSGARKTTPRPHGITRRTIFSRTKPPNPRRWSDGSAKKPATKKRAGMFGTSTTRTSIVKKSLRSASRTYHHSGAKAM